MNLLYSSLTLFCLIFVLPENEAACGRVVCYYGSWAVYRPGNGKFDVEQIDPTLCTHLIYAFAGVNAYGDITVLDPWNDLQDNGGKGAYVRFVNLKKKNPSAKVSIAVGGWNVGSPPFSSMAASSQARAAFVQNAVAFLQKYGFDGLDIDWEYPNQRGGQQSDVYNMVQLLSQLRSAFNQHGYLLSVAVGATASAISTSYDVPNLCKYVDFINLMTYDLHGSWDGVTGQNAPLYASAAHDTTYIQKQGNVKSCVEAWINSGADRSKINLGMGMYGRSFTLNNPSNTGLGSPSSYPGNAGPYTAQAGILGYNEIIEAQKNGGWNIIWDDEQKVPYMFKSNQWVGYDNDNSISMKLHYAQSMGLGGGMIWSIETDDFKGLCGTKFPLLKTIKNGIGGGSCPPHVTTTRHPPTTPAPLLPCRPNSLCKNVGYIRDPVECNKYYYCQQASGTLLAYPYICSPGTYFDPIYTNCNYPDKVKCYPPTTSAYPLPCKPNSLCKAVGYIRDPVECNKYYYCQQAYGTYLIYPYICSPGTYFDPTYNNCNYPDKVKC